MADLKSMFDCRECGQGNVRGIVCDWPVFETVVDLRLRSRNLSDVLFYFIGCSLKRALCMQ